MKALGWGLLLVAVACLLAIVGDGKVTWLVLVAIGTVFAVGLALVLGSQSIVLARRLAYMIRELRAAAKGEPEPAPPSPDLMQTIKPGTMQAPPKPDYHTPAE
jgi:hypothetical protein